MFTRAVINRTGCRDYDVEDYDVFCCRGLCSKNCFKDVFIEINDMVREKN